MIVLALVLLAALVAIIELARSRGAALIAWGLLALSGALLVEHGWVL